MFILSLSDIASNKVRNYKKTKAMIYLLVEGAYCS
jgi:hypothetical protein